MERPAGSMKIDCKPVGTFKSLLQQIGKALA
jgi:hypothetical protein